MRTIALACTPSGKTVVVANEHATGCWDAASGKKTVSHASNVELDVAAAIGTSEKEARLLIARGNKLAWCNAWDGSSLRDIALPFAKAETVAVSRDGRRAAAGDATGTVVAWDLATGKEIVHLVLATKNGAKALAFSDDGSRIFVVGKTLWLKCIDVATKDVAWSRGPLANTFVAIAALGGGGCVATSNDQTLRLFDSSGNETETVRIDGDRGLSLAAAHDGTFLLVGTARGRVLRFDLSK